MVDLPAIKGSNPGTPAPGSRPGTNRLEAVGSVPPSRIGTQGSTRLSTGARTGSKGLTPLSNSPMGVLAEKLILRMRAKFGPAASDVKAQEIITQEVMALVAKAGSVREEDIQQLELSIRSKLTGGSAPKHTLSMEKKLQQEGDEWAKIYEYSINCGKVLDERAAIKEKERRENLKKTLKGQMAEIEHRKKLEEDAELEYFKQEQATMRQWELEEEAKRKLQHDIMEKLKQDRVEQLREKESRRQAVRNAIAQDEARTAAKMAYQTRKEFEAEETARLEAKNALKEFLLQNEENRKIHEAAKLKRYDEDAKFKAAWEAQLDKQERDRHKQLEAVQAKMQHRQLLAQQREIVNKWHDDATIDRLHKQAEDARAAEEERRQQKVKNDAKAIEKALADQIKERETIKAKQREEDEAKARMVLARAEADERREQEKKAAALARRSKFKEDLDAQMKEKVLAKRVVPMSDTEKKINTHLLTDVQQFYKTGKVCI